MISPELAARLYEKLGEPAKAIAAYEKFIKRWGSADAPLQPQVPPKRGKQ